MNNYDIAVYVFVLKYFKYYQLTFLPTEPVIFFSVMAFATIYGAQIPTKLLMWKICFIQLNYSSEICANLSAGGMICFVIIKNQLCK